jgi:hypothetical protein
MLLLIFNALNHLVNYFGTNLSCLTVGVESATTRALQFMAHHSLLADMAELFGVLLVVTVLSTLAFTLIILVLETSARNELKTKTNLVKTSFYKKYAEVKVNLNRFL